MYRGMVFCDHSNFEIVFQDYYKKNNKPTPPLDYHSLFKNIVHLVPNVDFLKAIMFISRPDDESMKNDSISGHYKWESGIGVYPFIDIVEGDLRTNSGYREQKGVDINLAIHALSKAYVNAYDFAFIMSADSDFIYLYDMLKNLGKIVYVVIVKGQNISRIIPHIDDCISLDDGFFRTCLRNS